MITIDNFARKFTDEELTNVIQLKSSSFMVSDDVWKIKNKVDKTPFAAGLFLGDKKPFHPSMGMLDWLNERTDKYVVVDKKAAWLFLCGRDVFDHSIVKKNASSGLVLVKNEFGEVLGYGDLAQGKIALKNVLDRGDFLRREK